MIKLIREYLLEEPTIKKYVNVDVADAIFHEIKPPIKINNYIILRDKPLELSHVEQYQVDVIIAGKDLPSLVAVEKALRSHLNDVHGIKLILNDELHIKDSTMLIGGGRQYDEKQNKFYSVQYFRITI